MGKYLILLFLVFLFSSAFAQNRFVSDSDKDNTAFERFFEESDKRVFDDNEFNAQSDPNLKFLNSLLTINKVSPSRLRNIDITGSNSIIITPTPLNNILNIDVNKDALQEDLNATPTDANAQNCANQGCVLGNDDEWTDASNVTGGTLADAILSSNVCLEDITNVFTVEQQFTDGGSNFIYIDPANREIEFDSGGQAEIKTASGSILYRAGSGSPFHEFIGTLRPFSNNAYDLGATSSNKFRNLFLAGNAKVDGNTHSDINAPRICLNNDCRILWPVGGGVTGLIEGGNIDLNSLDGHVLISVDDGNLFAFFLDSNNTWTGVQIFNPFGSGDAISSEFDAEFGSASMGAIRIGATQIFQTDLTVAGFNLDGTTIFRNTESDSNTEFLFATSDNLVRFAIPKSGADFGIYNPRSMMVGGDLDQTFTSSIIECSAQGYDKIDCDTDVTGADLGVQDDLQVRGEIYADGNINMSDRNAINFNANTSIRPNEENQLEIFSPVQLSLTSPVILLTSTTETDIFGDFRVDGTTTLIGPFIVGDGTSTNRSLKFDAINDATFTLTSATGGMNLDTDFDVDQNLNVDGNATVDGEARGFFDSFTSTETDVTNDTYIPIGGVQTDSARGYPAHYNGSITSISVEIDFGIAAIGTNTVRFNVRVNGSNTLPLTLTRGSSGGGTVESDVNNSLRDIYKFNANDKINVYFERLAGSATMRNAIVGVRMQYDN